jgi:hypothetical protein
MAGNVQPQFTTNGNVSSIAVTAGNTSSEGGGTVATSIFLAFTAGVNGSFVESVLWMPTASAAATATNATIGRVFLSSVTTGSTTSANTYLIAEVSLPSVSADSTTVANSPIEITLNRRIPASWGVLVTNHVAPASSSEWIATVFGGDY